MSRVTAEAVVDAGRLAEMLRPRSGLIAERAVGEGVFEQAEGPARSYRRTVTVTGPGGPGGGVGVRQVVEFSLGVPYISWLFSLPLRVALGGIRPPRVQPWWAPPQRLDRRAAVVLATLCALAVVVGYAGGLLSLTMTYVARQFHVTRTAQGVALGVVRINVVLALGLLAVADRTGRRRMILGCAAGAAALTSVGALTPSLVWLTATEVLAVALTATLLVLISVMAAEEMPAGSRAWALAVLTMTIGFGAGLATAALPLADLGAGGWRWQYAFALGGLPLVASAARHLPESRRWQRSRASAPGPGGGGQPTPGRPGPDDSPPGSGGSGRPAAGAAAGRKAPQIQATHRRRLLLLSAGGFLFALFATPAGQFQNEFLRTQRAFSAGRITVFSLVTGTIGGAGVYLGGRLADLRGRRLVAAVGAGAGIVTTLAGYVTRGWPMWVWGVAGSLLGYAVAPALGVYGPELFPTSLRSRATGVIGISYAAGGVAGLILTGVLSGAIGTIAPALALLAVGPALLVVLIIWSYPETAMRELEDLNPADGPAQET